MYLVLNFGETLRDNIEQYQHDEDERKYSLLYKSITILITMINYIVGIWIIFETIGKYPEHNTLITITSLIVFGMAITLLAFNFYKECKFFYIVKIFLIDNLHRSISFEDIIVDASWIALYIIFIHYLAYFDFIM